MKIDGNQDERAPCTLLTEGDQNQEKTAILSHILTRADHGPQAPN